LSNLSTSKRTSTNATLLYLRVQVCGGIERPSALGGRCTYVARFHVGKQRLPPLIRCQHLSSFWLSALALSKDPPKLLLSEHPQRAQVQQLLMLLQGDPAFDLTAAQLQSLLPGAPSSWALPRRVSRQVSSVQMVRMLDVEAIRSNHCIALIAARSSAYQPLILRNCSSCAPTLSHHPSRLGWGGVWGDAAGAVRCSKEGQ